MYIDSIGYCCDQGPFIDNHSIYKSATVELSCITCEEIEKLYNLYRDRINISLSMPNFIVTKVIYHNPATIVFWNDGTKTVVKCNKDDTYDQEKGFYIACAKKLFGNNYAAVGRINKALEMAEDKND